MRSIPPLFTIAGLILALCLSGCADDTDDASVAGTSDEPTEVTTPTEDEETLPAQVVEVPADCGYDAALQGTAIGSHVESFKLYNQHGDIHNSHYDCGGGSKAVWVFLSTGWCGACNSYARQVEALYNAYSDQGLRVLWIVGEAGVKGTGSISNAEFDEYVLAHSPMSFTVVRDPGFNATETYLDSTTPALPHQYILDGTTMELVFKQGGTGEAGEDKIAELLGVDAATFKAAAN